jgi:hypothetical protein
LRLIVELGLESGCFVGRGAEDGAGAGGADEGKVGAGVLELDADGLMLDLVERQFFAADDGEGDLLGLVNTIAMTGDKCWQERWN